MSQKINIKQSHQNEYLITKSHIWVRNFCEIDRPFIDLNKNIQKDYDLFLENEHSNYRKKYMHVNDESFKLPHVVIVSDGYDFKNKHKLLANLPNNVSILAVNKSLAFWEIANKKTIHSYIINNPYKESIGFLPINTRYYPRCITSTKTSPLFLKEYHGNKYVYCSTNDLYYSGRKFDVDYHIDDYRNPICAAIHLAYIFGAIKIVLFCCDNAFIENKPGAISVGNNLYAYPQQTLTQEIIDAQAFWLSKKNIKIANCSEGINFNNCNYIKVDEIENFFNE